jgi:hypothetical protein
MARLSPSSRPDFPPLHKKKPLWIYHEEHFSSRHAGTCNLTEGALGIGPGHVVYRSLLRGSTAFPFSKREKCR